MRVWMTILPCKQHYPLKLARHTMRTVVQSCKIVPHPREIVTQGTNGQNPCDKLYQLVLDMKAEMGSMRKAMVEAGISFENVPNEQKTKHASDKGKQKNNFAGTAKKRNRKDKVAQRSLVAVAEKDSDSDSYLGYPA